MTASSRLHRVLAQAVLSLAVVGCATWQAPPGVDDAALRAHATTATATGVVRVSAVVVGTQTSRRMFGPDIEKANVQPIWIEVANRSPQPLWLLRSGTDPDYFSPLEVAWSMHRALAGTTNARIDETLQAAAFVNPIPPGATHAGVIFINPQRGTTLVNIDLFGRKTLVPFSLFLHPDDHDGPAPLTFQHPDAQLVDYEDLDALRSALEQLPCCATDASGSAPGDPLNAVLIGAMADIGAAGVRRDYRRDVREADRAQRVFGREPDFVGRKQAQGGSSASWIRMWATPMLFDGKPVYVAQVGRPVGGRFASGEARSVVLHHAVDEARNFMVQDMMYSGGLEKLGFITGAGEGGASKATFDGARYETDGLRAVLFFGTRPLSLAEIEILDWVPFLE
ncbi:MAG TPA: LssY C-terminal domain-containing protein [Lysobacter sp.]|nr:LssY C-terminal domain-containing protein [Lysobacter sp.]